MDNRQQRYILQIKERKIVKQHYAEYEIPFVGDVWSDYMSDTNFEKMKSMIDNSLCKSDYRILTYPQREVVYG